MKQYIYLSVLLIIPFLFGCQNKADELKVSDLEPYENYTLSVDDRTEDLISRLTLEEKVSQMMNQSKAIPRLDIPEYNWWSECLHGVARSSKATVFPQAIGLAATFDPDLIQEISTAISDEARAIYNIASSKGYRGQYKGLSFWSPNVNIFRDPRWGRGQETYGEDPFLSGILGAAFVRGLQGNDPDYLKAAACAKHYVVHSGPEGDRHHFNAIVNKKDLNETYLPAFKNLVDAGVEAVMCAYNRTNDEACCGSQLLLTEILRNNWDFKGHIVSDCGAIGDIHKNHNLTADGAESAALAIKHTVNLNCGSTYKQLTDAVERGLLTEQEIDHALRPLIKSRIKLGLLDPPEISPFSTMGKEVIHCKKHQELALEAATKSVVLLKNKNNTLPLEKEMKMLFITGPFAADVDVLLGNYYGISDQFVTVLEGLAGKVGAETAVRYKHGVLFDRENVNPIDWSTGNAAKADATIAVMGITPLIEGEEGEAIASVERGDRTKITLPESQIKYIKKLKKQAGEKPVILVITGGSPVAIPEIHDIVDAVLFIWYPGEQGGQAIADIVFGDAVPSGRLPVTFPESTEQLPPYDDYSIKGRTYRYMEDDPLYPFGFGLSFSQFEYSDIELNQSKINKGDTIIASVTITNKGKYAAQEVVQLYLTDIEASFYVPRYSLKGIQRIDLQPGEEKNVRFIVTPSMMKSINMEGNAVIEPGDFKIYIGGSSPGKRSEELGASMIQEKTFIINN